MSELKARIEKLKKLREAATEGKWSRTGSNYVVAPSCIVHQIEFNSAHIEETEERHKADALFIAAAANDAIPILTDCQSEIERLERQLEAAESVLVMVTPPNRKPGECYCPVGRNLEFGHSNGCKTARNYFAQSQKGQNDIE